MSSWSEKRLAIAAAADDYKAESVTVPEWDVTFQVRSLSVGGRNALMSNSDITVDPILFLLIACVYDPETDEPAFTVEDAAWLARQPVSGPVDQLILVAARLNEGTAEAVEVGKGDS